MNLFRDRYVRKYVCIIVRNGNQSPIDGSMFGSYVIYE